tara:strand:+ start:87 stop:521 length:435 start_codon:yes stop_codon:yes gene_type:complete
MKVSRNDLYDLTKLQLTNILKNIKDKLNLSVAGKNKDEIIDTLYNLHKGNKFFKKRLFSLDESGVIQLPKRETVGKKTTLTPLQEQIRTNKEKNRISNLQLSKSGSIELLLDKIKKIDVDKPGAKAKIEVIKAKMRAIEKKFNN